LTVPASKTVAAAVLMLLASADPLRADCKTIEAEAQRYTACSYQPGDGVIEVHNLNRDGEPFAYLQALATELAQDGKTLRFAMNAGMFDDNQRPIGLYVEEGRLAKKLNRRGGAGNFHLRPNGVFYVKDGTPGVLETEAFAKAGLKPDFASQSGPMLVINGKIHPKFSPTGTSRKRRNGVGVTADGVAHFVISDGAVTFWEFASLFRDELKVRNALFLDGSVSSLYAPALGRADGFLPVGPMVGVHDLR
jgi:uncharacterized protein YigE (DUF2233 family)